LSKAVKSISLDERNDTGTWRAGILVEIGYLILDISCPRISMDFHMAQRELRSGWQETILENFVEMRGRKDSGTVFTKRKEIFQDAAAEARPI